MKKSELNDTSPEIGTDTTEITYIEDHIWIDNELDGEVDGGEVDPMNNTSGAFIQDIFNSTDDGSSNATTNSTNAPTTEIDRIFNFTRPAHPERDPATNGSGPITTPQQQTLPPAWDNRIPSHNNEQYTPHFPEANMIIVGVLIALIVVLGMVLGVVTIPPLIHFFRRKIPVSQKRIDRRYATIDGWLITKTIKPHSDVCDRVRRYYGVDENGDGVGGAGSDEDGGSETVEFCQPVGTSPPDRNSSSVESQNLKTRRTLRRAEIDRLLSTESVISLKQKVLQTQQNADDGNDQGSEQHPHQAKGAIDGESHNGRDRRSRSHTLVQQSSSLVSTVTEITCGTDLSSIPPISTQMSDIIGNVSDDIDSVTDGHHDVENPPAPPSTSVFSAELSENVVDIVDEMATTKEEGDSGFHDVESCSECPSHSCPICLEKYEVDDMVSWSASQDCRHVFHYECIREWLLRRIGCPCCREIVLPVDRPPPPSEPPLESQEGPLMTRMYHSAAHHARSQTRRRRWLPKTTLQELASERAARAATSYFCVHDGLVTLLPRVLNHPLTPANQRQLELQRRLREKMERQRQKQRRSGNLHLENDTTPAASTSDREASAKDESYDRDNLMGSDSAKGNIPDASGMDADNTISDNEREISSQSPTGSEDELQSFESARGDCSFPTEGSDEEKMLFAEEELQLSFHNRVSSRVRDVEEIISDKDEMHDEEFGNGLSSEVGGELSGLEENASVELLNADRQSVLGDESDDGSIYEV